VAYAGAATRLAQAAVPVAAQLAAGRPAVLPEPQTLVPSDIVRMPHRHVPLVHHAVIDRSQQALVEVAIGTGLNLQLPARSSG
jgi:hypothetical protein